MVWHPVKFHLFVLLSVAGILEFKHLKEKLAVWHKRYWSQTLDSFWKLWIRDSPTLFLVRDCLSISGCLHLSTGATYSSKCQDYKLQVSRAFESFQRLVKRAPNWTSCWRTVDALGGNWWNFQNSANGNYSGRWQLGLRFPACFYLQSPSEDWRCPCAHPGWSSGPCA